MEEGNPDREHKFISPFLLIFHLLKERFKILPALATPKLGN
jgi:hypothetical protein